MANLKVPEEVRKAWETEEVEEMEAEAQFEVSGLNKKDMFE